MPNINYIASAGTGKTYKLVELVIDKVLNEDIPLKDMLILTFSEKAATEIKERIAKRIKELLSENSLNKGEKVRLHRQLIFLDNSYIGTFHSVFLRFLKRFPEKSKIDNSFSILPEGQIDQWLELLFDKWIEADFENDKDRWEEILGLFEGKINLVKKFLKALYSNRLKLSFSEINLENQKQEIQKIKKQIFEVKDEFIKNPIYEILKNAEKEYPQAFKLKPSEILNAIENDAILSLRLEEFFIKKSIPNSVPADLKKELKQITKSPEFLHLQNKLIGLIKEYQQEFADYRANLILSKFYQFLDFVKKEKTEKKIIDFDDILQKTLELLEDNQATEHLKDQFKYIFVDEFQDTDRIQTEILKRISDHNIYVFGDPKQCIYTWRNADLDIYFDFLEKNNFQDKILDTNYRSTPQLVEFFNRLFSDTEILAHINEEFRKPVKPSKNNSIEDPAVRLISIKDTPEKQEITAEAFATAQVINQLVLNGRYDYRDISILFDRNDDINEFLNIFNQLGIPAVSLTNIRYSQLPEIRLLIDCLRFIENPEDSLLATCILKSPVVLSSDEEIYKNGLKSEHRFFRLLKGLSDQKYKLSVEQIIDRIFQEFPFLEVFSVMEDGLQKVKNLKMVKTLAKKKTFDSISLQEFIRFLEDYEATPVNSKDNAVQLMTMHKSKGLQNEVIIIPLIWKNFNLKLFGNIHIYEDKPLIYLSKAKSKLLNDENIEKFLKDRILQEKIRLFYVATTRAKEQLIFISANNKGGKNSILSLINEFLPDKTGIHHEEFRYEDITPESQAQQTEPIDLLQLKEVEQKEKKIRNISFDKERFTSVTKLMEEEKEEISFGKKSEENLGIYIGILTHEVLEDLDFENFSTEQLEKLVQQKKNIVPQHLQEKVIQYVEEIMERFLNSEIYKELKTSQILFRELPFILKDNSSFVEGRIDIVYRKNKKIYVMDFKTNRYESPQEKDNIIRQYQKQKEYYLKAIKKLFPEEDIYFSLGLLWKGEIVLIP
ncbi:UvrD-helicase domain-containing protein [Persephonella sp. IF05-L8]|uniref:UvrD-helicase domain-containing protein n=1 Tax=Persephonella sp. IF05-L8 TaxID=1158338 RepID=UPI0004980029